MISIPSAVLLAIGLVSLVAAIIFASLMAREKNKNLFYIYFVGAIFLLSSSSCSFLSYFENIGKASQLSKLTENILSRDLYLNDNKANTVSKVNLKDYTLLAKKDYTEGAGFRIYEANTGHYIGLIHNFDYVHIDLIEDHNINYDELAATVKLFLLTEKRAKYSIQMINQNK